MPDGNLPFMLKRSHSLDILIIVVGFVTLSKAHSISILIFAVVRESCSNCKLIWALSLAVLDSIDTVVLGI